MSVNATKRKDENRPLDDDELTGLFSVIPELAPSAIVVAVSGGPDSMALMTAIVRWRDLTRSRVHIVIATVNHGLRSAAEAECALVLREAKRLGVEGRLLHWEGEKPKTGIQEKAREARYQLLFDLCKSEKASLLTAHTLDDQAETVMMRLARGSGISGLGGMPLMRVLDHGRHLRPLLPVAKSRLIASCRAWDTPFVEDPSNQCEDFARVRWRMLLPVLAAEGLDADRIVRFAERLERADHALARQATRALHAYLIEDSQPDIRRLDARSLHNNEDFEIILRVYGSVIGKGQQLRLYRLEDCVRGFHKAVGASTPLRRTLAGVMISLDKNGILTFEPEPLRKRGLGISHAENVADEACALGKRGEST